MSDTLSIREMNVLREVVWHAVQRGDIPDGDREILHGLYPRLSGDHTPKLITNGTEALHFHLIRAENHAQSALGLLYGPNSVKRSMWFRMALGRAQSILMSLYVRDIKFERKVDEGMGTERRWFNI